jgi:hypothetical protein
MTAAPQATITGPEAGQAGMLRSMPRFDTGLPIIGVINFQEPMEWVFWGGLAATFIFVKGNSKWIIAAGIIAARYEFGKQ